MWIQLQQEGRAALRFVGLTDLCSHPAEPVQTAEETTVGRMLPADVARATPTVGPKRVQTPVISHAVRAVALDRVTAEVAELGPRLEGARPSGDHASDGVAPSVSLDGQRCGQRIDQLGRWRWEDGLGESG